jgi:hypothetical protein
MIPPIGEQLGLYDQDYDGYDLSPSDEEGIALAEEALQLEQDGRPAPS